MVETALRRRQVHPECIQLEETGSALQCDLDEIKRQIRNLRGLGLSLAIDDLGGGTANTSPLPSSASIRSGWIAI